MIKKDRSRSAAKKKPEISRAEKYARDVVGKKIVAGRLMIKACERFLSDLERDDIYFDIVEANKIVNFAERYCVLWEDAWAGEPVVITPWMAFILQQLYGWFYTKSKLRRFRKCYVQVAKKNAKSTLAAVLANYHLYADKRINTPKIFVGANSEDQAKIAVNISGQIIKSSPTLFKAVEEKKVRLFNYKENIVNVVHYERNGFIKSLSKETESKLSKQAGAKQGLNPSLGIIDEYAMADSSSLMEAIQTGQAARKEPLMFIITTAGHKINGPCYQNLRRTGIDILEGVTKNDTYLVCIFEMDKGDLITDRKNWIKSNPNLGVSVQVQFLIEQLQLAKDEGGATDVNVRTFNFNEWCETPEVWIPRDVWVMNHHKRRVEDLQGMESFGGLQLLGPKHLQAFTMVFPYAWKNTHAVKTTFWMPEKGALIENQMKMDFGKWADEGFIKTCPGNTVDNDFIFDLIFDELSQYQMHSLAFPAGKEESDIIQALVRAEVECNPISKGPKANGAPTEMWEKMLTAKEIEHFHNPVLAWSNSQTMAIVKADEIKVERAGGKTAGIISCIYAIAQWKTVEAGEDEEAGIAMVNM